MKTFLGIIAVCLLSGCAVNNGIFMKRKYTGGIYISAIHKKQEPHTNTFKENAWVQAKEELTITKPDPIILPATPEQVPLTQTPAKIIKPNKAPVAFAHSTNNRSYPHQLNFNDRVKRSLDKQLKRTSDVGAAAKFVLYSILFVVLTIIYAIVIVAKNPGFPWALAIVVAMLGALLTLVTGQLFI